jgi:hypothetical protein
MTNTSKEVIREDACSTGGNLYKLIILYNGVQQEEPSWRRKRREAAEAGEERGGDCPGVSNPSRDINPSDYVEDFIFYETPNPGTYEFIVEEKTFSQNSQTGVVKSNPLTVVVSPEDAQAPPK